MFSEIEFCELYLFSVVFLPNGIKSLIHVTHSPPPPPPSYFVKNKIELLTSVQSQANCDIPTHWDKTEKSVEMSPDKVLIIKLYR